MREIKGIVIHCSGTSPSEDIGAEEIRAIHKARGFHDIGYHVVIKRNGQIEPGRPIEKAGAHVKGHNAYTIGICLIGGLKEDGLTIQERISLRKWGTSEFNFTKAQMTSLDSLLNSYSLEFPDAETCGHRDFPRVNKACPCFDVGEYFGKVVID